MSLVDHPADWKVWKEEGRERERKEGGLEGKTSKFLSHLEETKENNREYWNEN